MLLIFAKEIMTYILSFIDEFMADFFNVSISMTQHF